MQYTLDQVLHDPNNEQMHGLISQGLCSIVGDVGEFVDVSYAMMDSAIYKEYLQWHKVGSCTVTPILSFCLVGFCPACCVVAAPP